MACILIIDDDQLISSSLSRCFADLGHTVLTAEGLVAGTKLAMQGVDVIYLDLNLPDGDGRTAITKLSSSTGNREGIVLTGQSDNFGAKETLTSGAWDHIKKPATQTPCDLLWRIRSSIARAKERLMGKAATSEASVLILG